MGREIRRVPPHWEHPRQSCPHSPWAGGCSEAKASDGQCYQPLHDRTFREAAADWKAQFAAWERGERPEYCDDAESRALEFWEWHGEPPDRKYYRPDWPEGTATWFQVYETVSEGTPVTPAFATEGELIEHLVAHGDDWDQSRGHGGWSRANAEQFVKRAWAPSMVVMDGTIKMPRDGA